MQIIKLSRNQQLTKNFNLNEFSCNDFAKTPVPQELQLNVVYLATQLQKIRDTLNLTLLRLNSAYRTKHHNERVKGASSSNHLTASAVDMVQYNMSNDSFFNHLKQLIKLGYIPDGEIIKYDTFVHYAPIFEILHFPLKNTIKNNTPYNVPLFTYSQFKEKQRQYQDKNGLSIIDNPI